MGGYESRLQSGEVWLRMKVECSPLPSCDRCWRCVETDRHVYWPEDRLCQRCVETLLTMVDKCPPYKMAEGAKVYVSELEVWAARRTDAESDGVE